MSRKLRIAFAMGGGVSLGTFSGAALARALRHLALDGMYPVKSADGTWSYAAFEPHDIVVDVFSGASAGAMSLGIMLRGLACPTHTERADAEARVLAELGTSRYESLDPARRALLVGAEVVAGLQRRAWAELIHLDQLLPLDSERWNDLPSVLDPDAVREIAEATLHVPKDMLDFSHRTLLGDRVLFATALSNLSPLVHDARGTLAPHEIGWLGLADGMTTRAHRDLRVFDLQFHPASSPILAKWDQPGRWVRRTLAEPTAGALPDGTLHDVAVWADIAATTIAAGAFPGAFAPVVLMREAHEYGERLWPAAFRERGWERFPFTFVDGGVFNNEPIREAFRLASFMDAQYRAQRPDEDYDRLVIFVDPSVDATPLTYRLGVHETLDLVESHRQVTRPRGSVGRLATQLGALVGAIADEAAAVELDKIAVVRNRFALRDRLRLPLARLVGVGEDGATDELKELCQTMLSTDRAGEQLPAGRLTLAGELGRVMDEEIAHLESAEGAQLTGAAERAAVLRAARGKAQRFLDHREQPEVWTSMLLDVAVDLLLGLEGKQQRQTLVAISPVWDPGAHGEPEPMKLPGHVMMGFGGFTTTAHRPYELHAADRAARGFLHRAGYLLDAGDPERIAPFAPSSPEHREAFAVYAQQLERGLQRLGERLGRLVKDAIHLPGWLLLPIPLPIGEIVVGRIADGVAGALEREQRAATRFHLRITPPDAAWRVVFPQASSDPTEVASGQHDLEVFMDWRVGRGEPGSWRRPTDEAERVTRLELHRDGFPRHHPMTAALPSPEMVEDAKLLPNAILWMDASTPATLAEGWHMLPGVQPLADRVFRAVSRDRSRQPWPW